MTAKILEDEEMSGVRGFSQFNTPNADPIMSGGLLLIRPRRTSCDGALGTMGRASWSVSNDGDCGRLIDVSLIVGWKQYHRCASFESVSSIRQPGERPRQMDLLDTVERAIWSDGTKCRSRVG